MMLLSEAAKAINAELIGNDAMFTSVDTDSRQVVPGQLFVALKGENHDGHDYAQQAIQQGAAAVLVSKPVVGAEPALVVSDTYLALGALAAYWRSKFTLPVAAITGSNGKTTVKEMLATILREAAGNIDPVRATMGNLNNHIGLPLTLLKLSAQHQYAVIEMGMNHTGEIRYLTHIAKPSVALINNAGLAHLGELGSVEAIAKAKAEIFEGLADDGVAVINADDEFAALWIGMNSGRKVLTFGLKNTADVTATYQLEANASQLEITTPIGTLHVSLPVPGLHNVMNALAATAAAIAMEVKLDVIAIGLEGYAGVKGRLQYLEGIHGALVIDDSYNANPISMQVAIDVLAARPGEKLLVLGDMGELGEDAAEMHAALGHYAKAARVDALFTQGELSVEISKAFGIGAKHYSTKQELITDLLQRMKPEATVLVKGSRFMEMERIVNRIVATSVEQKETNPSKGAH